MIEFIVQYWVQFLFGLIIAGGSFLIKHGWNNYKKAKQREQQEFFDKIDEKINEFYNRTIEDDTTIREEVAAIKKGLLSVQGAHFKEQCNKLLEVDHITTEEYTQLVEDHHAYNGLNGNHQGDSLFKLVEEKVKNQSK